MTNPLLILADRVEGLSAWAVQKACVLSGWRDWAQLKRSHPGPKAKLPRAVLALARYVEANDIPPVDEFEDFHAAISVSATTGFQNRDNNRVLFEALCQLLASRIEADTPADDPSLRAIAANQEASA